MSDQKAAEKAPAAQANGKAETKPAPKQDRARSPSYPAFPLSVAIERARVFYNHENFNWAYGNVAMRHWNLSPTSSTGLRTLAALLHFGLFEEKGASNDRQVRLSTRARTILLAPEGRSDERDQAIREAAIAPKLYATLWAKYGPNLPSSQNLEFDLVRTGNYNADSIRDLIADFRATVEFANLGQAAKLETQNGDKSDGPAKKDAPSEDLSPKREPQETEKKMPSIGRANSVPFDLTIPLISGGQAILRVPRPMSEDDYTLLTTLLEANLKAIKRALVSSADAPGVTEQDSAD